MLTLFYLVANVIVWRPSEGRCLMLRRSLNEAVHPGPYCFPGGKLEWAGLDISHPARVNGDVLDSEGDWSMTVSVEPPEGFTADHEAITAEVDSEYKAIQFTLTDVGSCWECGTGVSLEIRHKGKIERLSRRIPTPMTEAFAKAKGLKREDLEARGVRVTKKGRRWRPP